MMNLNKKISVALMALTMMVGAQSACADTVVEDTLAVNTNKPFGFATVSSRTENTAYSITGGGVYDVRTIQNKIDGKAKNTQHTIDGKRYYVLTSDGTSDMLTTIRTVISENDIIVFDGSGESTDFLVSRFVTISGLSNKTIIGINGARICTKWHLTDIIKSWLNAVETSSGSGVSNASTASGTGGSFWLKNIADEDSIQRVINEEGEYLTRKTLVERGQASWRKVLAGKELSVQDEENIQFLRTELYQKSGVFYFDNCTNFIIRNLSFQGPGSVDVGGQDLISAINGTNHMWVDHCEFIDGQDGNFDITNESDFITVSWCHFRYTDYSYVHQNTNLVGSGDDKDGVQNPINDVDKLNITFAYNEWGENCRSRMPMARFGKIHMLNNWYNCVGNTENAINPRKQSEFLVEGNYFADGITKTFKNNGSTGVTASDNRVGTGGTAITSSGSTVTVPYDYDRVATAKVPDMVDMLVGPWLDKIPTFTINPDNHEEKGEAITGYYLETNQSRATQGLTFSVWAENVLPNGYQWYSCSDMSKTSPKKLKDEIRNSFTFTMDEKAMKDTTFYVFCTAIGISDTISSNPIKVVISGSGAPRFSTDLDDSYEFPRSAEKSLTVEAGDAPTVTYQWYKNTVQSTEGATLLEGETGKTYTYTTPSNKEVEFIYCIATNTVESMSATSNIARVMYSSRTRFIDWKADADLPVFGIDEDLNGISIPASSTATPESKNSLGCLKLANSPSSDFTQSNGYKLTIEGGYSVGDKITFAGFTAHDSKDAHVRLMKFNTSTNLFSDIDGTPTEEFVNITKTPGASPVSYSYNIQEGDLDGSDGSVYIARNGGTSVWLTKILVVRDNPEDPIQPYITKDLDGSTPYEATVNKKLELSITAEDASSYKWYTCNTASSYETGKSEIVGQTTEKYDYTPTVEGTVYMYAVAFNGTGEHIKSDTTSIATIVVTREASAGIPHKYVWDFKDWSGFVINKSDGDTQNFAATNGETGEEKVEYSNQQMYYYGPAKAFASNTQSFGGVTWTKYIQFDKGNLTTEKEKNIFKYSVPFPGTITIYAKGGSSSGDKGIYINTTLSTSGANLKKWVGNDGSNIKAEGVTYEITEATDIYVWGFGGSNYIYAIVADLEEPAGGCAVPSYEKGAWSADATQKWTYTISSTTEGAYLHYTINDGDEQIEEANSKTLSLSPDDKVVVWAVDPTGELETSREVEFTAEAADKADAPTVQMGNYDVTRKGFKVSLKVTSGCTLYYTTDGSEPTTSSSSRTTNGSIYVSPGSTVKAMQVKSYYGNSDVTSVTAFDFIEPGDEDGEIICWENGISKNIGISYTVQSNFNAGSYATSEKAGIKYRTNSSKQNVYVDNVKNKGFKIDVNKGFVIKKIEIKDLQTNRKSTESGAARDTICNIYVDGATTDIRVVNGGEATNVIGPFSDESKNTLTLDNLNARDSLTFVCKPGYGQMRAKIQVYYEIDDSPVSVTVTGKVNGAANEQTIAIEDFTENSYTIDKATKKYDEIPTVKLNTTQGYHYDMIEVTGDGDYTRFAFKLMGTTYQLNAKVVIVNAPHIKIDKEGGIKFYKDGSGNAKGGYKVILEGINTGSTPYIILDGADAVVYDENKEYYALKTVDAYSRYTDPETGLPAQTSNRGVSNCPDNTYDASKPFAVYMYKKGYSDTGAGQGNAATQSTWNKNEDQTYLGLTDQYNVIDLELNDDQQHQMVTEVRPDIRNAKLVVISEMIGSTSPEASSVYSSSGLQEYMMSVRDSLIGYTNVLNLKMFFYSQSKNNNTRWAWAQPATLPNDKVAILPTDPLYEVFKNVSFSGDGSVKLWSDYDEESTLNHLQLVHNFNEENDDLPQFTVLATAQDDDGETYDALHWFKKNGYQYIATGISINDYEHYDKNLHSLISAIGSMINEGIDLDHKLSALPAPRIKDNGDGSATITNNNPASSTTYYRTSENDNETWDAAAIRDGGETVNAKFLTKKFITDKYVYAVTYTGETASAVASAVLVEGTNKRYLYRTTTEEGVEGIEAVYAFTTEEASAGNVTVPYNQSFSKPGYTVTSWKIKDSEPARYYTPGSKFAAMDNMQDVYLEAVWTENAHLITDADTDETEEMRTVTWNFRLSDGAPALSLESGSTKLGQTGIIVGQMKFNDGTFIDVPMTIDASGSATLPLSTGNVEQTGKFNNTSTNYVDNDFAQVRTGVKFKFPAVYGMTVKYVPTCFVKSTGTDKYEVDSTYVTMSTLTDGILTLKPSNQGLATADGKITLTEGGLSTVAIDNRATGGIYNYNGVASTATLTSIDASRLCAPSTGTTDEVVGSLNGSASVFMDKLTVTYPQLYDLTTNIILPMDNDSISAEPQVTVDLTEAYANCGGRYNADRVLDITVTPSYSYYLANTDAVAFTPAAAQSSKDEFAKDGKTGVVTGKFTIQPNTVANITVSQQTVYEYTTDVTPLDWGSVRIDSRTGKDESTEYLKFAKDSVIIIKPTPKMGYQFSKWVNSGGTDLVTKETNTLADKGVERKGSPWRGDLQVTVNSDNATPTYKAVFEKGNEGTVYYQLKWAGLYEDATHYSPFGETLAPGDSIELSVENQARYQYAWQYPNYKFPTARTTTALYIPTNYTLYKPGYTLKNWVYIPGFDPGDVKVYYENKEEYQIGDYYYFDSEGEERNIIPIFKVNPANFDYRTTTADITWDFRTGYRAQRLYFPEKTEEGFYYATHTVINGNDTIDVPLHIKGIVNNTVLDEWCHFDEGTEIKIPSGLGATFTLATYNKLTSTTIDGVVPTDYTKVEENAIPVYYYTYTTPSAATSVMLHIGKDHTYYKSIRAQLPAADKVDLTTTVNNSVQGSVTLESAASDEEMTSPVSYTEVAINESDTTYTMALGSYVMLKATRNRLYELKSFVVDGDTITAANAAKKGYTMTVPSGTDKEYTLKFRLFSYNTTVEAVYGNRQIWQITFSAGSQASGEAPGVIVVEDEERFDMPIKNQTLYLEGYTLDHWVDDDGNVYEWNTNYLPTKNLYLSPVFEVNEFTLFDITGETKVKWPLATGSDPKYGGAPLLKYQKSSGVYVSQLWIGEKFIDMPLTINCTTTGKVDNSATDYRCQVNSGSAMTVMTNSNGTQSNCTVTLYTSNGTLSSTQLGKVKFTTNDKEAGTVNDYYSSVVYVDKDGTQEIKFSGDAAYFKMVEVTYKPVATNDLPKLDYAAINNIALGSYGTLYEDYTLSTLIKNHTITIPITLSSTALTMPKVTAKADAKHSDAIIEVSQATVADTTATIILKNKAGSPVGVYKILFEKHYTEMPDPVLQKIEMDGQLVKSRNQSGVMTNYLERGATMAVNGAISITFDHEMNVTDLEAINNGLGQTMTCTSTNSGKTLQFAYWGLYPNTDYTFSIPAGVLSDVYGNTYKKAPSDGDNLGLKVAFRTDATSTTVENRVVNFVVTHAQTHTFNSASNGLENYTSSARRQIASDELIANLEKKGIAYGTIDEGIALSKEGSQSKRYFIFVPDGEYQLRGNQTTDAISSDVYDGKAKAHSEFKGNKIYNGITAISRSNVSITGQSQDKTILWNDPFFEGISYTSTFMVNSGVQGFYVQDMTLKNAFDYKTGAASGAARAVVLRDRGAKTIMKNVTMDSWQDTYYSNTSNSENDTRGYFENCTILGYVDFFCGDGDHWFEKCDLVLRNRGNGNAVNMAAPATYTNQKWGYIFNKCEIKAEDDASYKVNNGKFTLARPWKNSPAVSFLDTKFNVLSTDDGYKQMTTEGLVLRMHEYGSTDGNGTLLDLSARSLRASSPGAGSYSAVMTPDESYTYTVHNALGGDDGYDPTLYTKQISMENAGLTSADRSLTWEAQAEALCYFIFRKDKVTGDYLLYAVTDEDSYELDDEQIGRTFIVRAANQRGGLGEPSNEFTYEVHESFKLELIEKQKAPYNDEDFYWSTIYLDYNAKAPTQADGDATAEVAVYAVVDVQGTQMTLKRVKVLEKNQGYIVKGTKAGIYTFPYTDSDGDFYNGIAPSEGKAHDEGRMSVLDGVVEDTERDGMYVFTMYYKAAYGLGFYNYTGEELAANKAYLDGKYVTDDSEGGIVIDGDGIDTGFIILDDDATDIKRLRRTADDDSERIYTVYGQRVKRSEMIKGRVYIVNGMKIAY
ncbi:MAG: chitobiase/beta-hexosaminidase C-terminal domain-containing protein [Prevotella sp.]|nr:chitobiase/beta-hexosaminidase C-terminal domain-containing protein [Prevotella sp.]